MASKHIHLHIHTEDAEPEGKWVTIHGARVFIGKDGEIKKGPASLVGKKSREAGKGKTRYVVYAKLAEVQRMFPKAAQRTIANMKVDDGRVVKDANGKDWHVRYLKDGYHVKPWEGAGNLARDPAGPKDSDKRF